MSKLNVKEAIDKYSQIQEVASITVGLDCIKEMITHFNAVKVKNEIISEEDKDCFNVKFKDIITKIEKLLE